MKKAVQILLVAALGLLSASILSAATINVPGDYATIQAAINAANPNDIIVVAAGTYAERITINKSLEFRGAQYGIDPTPGGARTNPAAESIIDISGLPLDGNPNVAVEIPAGVTNVVVDGFTLIGSPISHWADEAVVRCWDDNLSIQNNIIDGYYGVLYKGNDYATFSRNRVTANEAGIAVQPNAATHVTISGNKITPGGSPASDDQGIYLTGDSYTSVTGNTVTGFTNNNAVGGSSHDHMTVSGNTFTGNNQGINLWGNTRFITITSNTVRNSVTRGITIKGQDVTISGNFINNNPVGIRLDVNTITTERITIFNNDLSGNATLAVQVMPAVVMTVDASANWWGASTASGVAAKITGLVDYTPWLDGGSDTSGDPGFQGDFSALHVDDNSPQVGSAGRIQEGIDLVSGSTVYVEVGTYTEQVEIAKDLTLLGGGGGCVIQSPNTLTKFFMTGTSKNCPIIYVHDAGNVIVKDLVVDGVDRGNANHRFIGIGYRNAGGGVEGCTIRNITDTPFSSNESVSLYAYNDDGAGRSLAVWDNTIFGFQKNAMALNAGDTTPLTVDVRRNTVTGSGAIPSIAQNGIQVWADMGSGTVADNVVSGIGYSGTYWAATGILNYYADLDITGNTVTNGHLAIYNIDGSGTIAGNHVTVSRIGDYADGIIASDPLTKIPSPFDPVERHGAPGGRSLMGPMSTTLDVHITGNTVTFSGPSNTGSGGIEAYAGWGPDNIDLTVDHNVVTGLDLGIYVYKCTSDCGGGVFTNIAAHYNSIVGNTSYGMYSNVNDVVADARNNWWGAASGPYHATLNSGGTGNAVSDYILFDPWFGAPNEVSIVPTATLTNCSTTETVTFRLDQVGIPTDVVRGYEVKFSLNPAVATAGSFVQRPFLSSVGTTQFYAVNNGGGVYTVSCAILGPTAGATGGGDLFNVTLTPVAGGTSNIAFTSVKIRDLNNAALAGAGLAGSIRVDCTAPTMDAIVETPGGWYNAAPVLSHFRFSDDLNLDLAQYNYDGGTWVTPPIFTGIDAASWDGSPWTLPNFASLSEGSHTIYFHVRDDAGNWNTGTISWQFNKDTVAPAPPTSFVALPGNQKVHLTWTNASDGDIVGVEIRRVAWGGYPEYGTPGPPFAPSYPADHNAGIYVTLATGAAYVDPIAPRDIYYYAAFSKDHAGNYSTLGSTAYDRSTNYWLGDVNPDGYVGTPDPLDLVIFSSAFGSSDPGGGWNNNCDFGPTDDYSRFGIPMPDNTIDFEDLMIFAMNWNNVTPAGLGTFVATHVVENLKDLVKFDVVSIDDNTISIVLRNGAAALKGVRVVVNVSGADLQKVNRGSFFAGRSDLFYGTLPATAGDADICAAALGVGTPLVGSGEIARLVVKPTGNSSAVVTIETVDLRNVDNEKTEINAPEQHETPFVPKAAALMQNFPNPFNPVTTLTYDVAQTGNVTIQIYDVSGRLVTTLLNARVAVGRHTVEWNGKNANGSLVPSGIYFYRMKTAGYEATRKMILVR